MGDIEEEGAGTPSLASTGTSTDRSPLRGSMDAFAMLFASGEHVVTHVPLPPLLQKLDRTGAVAAQLHAMPSLRGREFGDEEDGEKGEDGAELDAPKALLALSKVPGTELVGSALWPAVRAALCEWLGYVGEEFVPEEPASVPESHRMHCLALWTLYRACVDASEEGTPSAVEAALCIWRGLMLAGHAHVHEVGDWVLRGAVLSWDICAPSEGVQESVGEALGRRGMRRERVLEALGGKWGLVGLSSLSNCCGALRGAPPSVVAGLCGTVCAVLRLPGALEILAREPVELYWGEWPFSLPQRMAHSSVWVSSALSQPKGGLSLAERCMEVLRSLRPERNNLQVRGRSLMGVEDTKRSSVHAAIAACYILGGLAVHGGGSYILPPSDSEVRLIPKLGIATAEFGSVDLGNSRGLCMGWIDSRVSHTPTISPLHGLGPLLLVLCLSAVTEESASSSSSSAPSLLTYSPAFLKTVIFTASLAIQHSVTALHSKPPTTLPLTRAWHFAPSAERATSVLTHMTSSLTAAIEHAALRKDVHLAVVATHLLRQIPPSLHDTRRIHTATQSILPFADEAASLILKDD